MFFPCLEEVDHCDKPDRCGVTVCGGGELLGEALRSAPARVRPDSQRTLDVLTAAHKDLQTPSRLYQHTQAGGKTRPAHMHTQIHTL